MCGICFIWNRDGAAVDRDLLRRMTDSMSHRGPDDSGLIFDDVRGVGCGFRRLSILDLSVAGHQPMSTPDGTLTIVFNGEVYNYAEIREQLRARGYAFRSNSDTEVILQAYAEWGEDAVQRFIGMFAVVIWDRKARRVFAARDRLGVKPLYYAADGRRLAVASELKPLMLLGGVNRTVDAGSLQQFLGQGYISAPRSILQGVRSLPPGHLLRFAEGDAEPSIAQYWSPLQAYSGTQRARYGDCADHLDELLRSAVKYRLLSDVPLGAFLSGGVDSSVVVALMRQVTTSEVRTFTVGFEEEEHDESKYAEAIARHLGTTHTSLQVTATEAKQVIPEISKYYDEPFADSSQIPTLLLSKITRQHVTVALSGDGGDELFCGYDGYRRMASWQRLWRIPSAARKSSAAVLNALPVSPYIRLAGRGLAAETPTRFYYGYYTSVWRPHEIRRLLPWSNSTSADCVPPLDLPAASPLLDRLMLHDMANYLPNDILTKVDRASMAVSLEARVPILDHRVVEYAVGLPLGMKFTAKTSKRILREVLHRYVPRDLVERPKHGFGVPLDQWLRSDLKWLLDEYLNHSRLRRQGIFDPAQVRAAVERFLASGSSHSRVWTLLVFQMWLDRYGCSA